MSTVRTLLSHPNPLVANVDARKLVRKAIREENKGCGDDLFQEETTDEPIPPASTPPPARPKTIPKVSLSVGKVLPVASSSTPSVPSSQPNKRKKKRDDGAKQRKKRKGIAAAIARNENREYGGPKPRPKPKAAFQQKAEPLFTNVNISQADVTSTSFTAKNSETVTFGRSDSSTQDVEKYGEGDEVDDDEGDEEDWDDEGEEEEEEDEEEEFPYEKRVYQLDELVGENSLGFQYVSWDGRTPRPIVDIDGIGFGVMAGQVNDDNWPGEQETMADILDAARATASASPGDQTPRRGEFKTMRCGVSHGGGQTQPMNLKNTGNNLKTINRLNNHVGFQRLASFTSVVFKCWASDLHDYYERELGKLFKRDKKLRPTFSTVFTATTYNLGPKTECFPHLDFANLAFGWCSVTALGRFDPTKGGHLILWEARLVIEFPPGSTILLASALIHHSNIAIQQHERRFSFTQYSAGALFRWVENEFMTADAFKAKYKRNKRKQAEVRRRNKARWEMGLSLMPRHKLRITVPACK